MDGRRLPQHSAHMEMLAAGIALWTVGSLLLGLMWIAAGQAATRRTARPSLLLPTPRPEYVDLTDAADVAAVTPARQSRPEHTTGQTSSSRRTPSRW